MEVGLSAVGRSQHNPGRSMLLRQIVPCSSSVAITEATKARDRHRGRGNFKTSVTDVYGVGPIVAALIIGHSGDITRFASRHHYASYNGTAPKSTAQDAHTERRRPTLERPRISAPQERR